MTDIPNSAPTIDVYDGVDAADRSYAEQIVSADPVYGTVSAMTVTGSLKLRDNVPLEALSPQDANLVRAKLRAMPPAGAEANMQRLINEVVYAKAVNARVMGGLGPTATPYHREIFGIERELRDLGAQHLKIAEELTEVIRWDNVVNPETGQREPKAVEKVQGARRVALQQEMDRLNYRMTVIEKIERPRRLNEALKQTVSQEKARVAEIEDAAEAERRAEKQMREERITRMADAKVTMLRTRS